jgi:hypothetical protein
MRNLRTYLLVSLFSCFGFIVGFAVCRTFFVPDEQKQAATSSLAEKHLILLPSQAGKSDPDQGATGYLVQKNQAGSPPVQEKQYDDGRELVTLLYPTFPPRVCGTFDPLEEFAKESRRTNR